jgi:hypothetical protein
LTQRKSGTKAVLVERLINDDSTKDIKSEEHNGITPARVFTGINELNIQILLCLPYKDINNTVVTCKELCRAVRMITIGPREL